MCHTARHRLGDMRMASRKGNFSNRQLDIRAGEMEKALACLEGRWKLIIISRLCANSILRLSELQRAIPKISQKMLIQQLRGLERDGIVRRTIHPQVPPKVEYGLTGSGKALKPVSKALLDWVRFRSTSGDKSL
jgi:DNA-binding HxlR family transcriptional regulator